jgi:hypothetical protein
MRSVPDTDKPVSNTRLYGLATLLGLVGVALLIVQALYWIPSEHANRAVIKIAASVPFLSALVFTVVPRRYQLNAGTRYAWSQPVVYLTLGAPVLIAILTFSLMTASGSFDDFSGFTLTLGALAGSDLKNFVYCWLYHRSRS